MQQKLWEVGVISDFQRLIDGQIPGAYFAIMHHGEIIAEHCAGFAQIKNKIPVGQASHFRIASMSKSVTCMAVMRLVAEGKVQLEAPAENYVAELKNLTYLHADDRKISVRDLMTHLSGFPEDNLWGDRHLDWQDADLIAFLNAGVAFSNPPETAFEYSNLAFGILGQLINRVAGMRYQDYIKAHIFKPLGMNDTYWEINDVPAAQLVYGYRLVEGQFQREPMLHDGAFGAMGGLITTMHDFARYIRFHLAAYSDAKDAGIISKAARREMHRPWAVENVVLNGNLALMRGYGYGLRYMQDNFGNKFIGHSGSLPGFNSHWWMLPQYDLAIISFANAKYPKVQPFNLKTIEKLIHLPDFARTALPVSAILQQRFTELLNFMPDYTGGIAALDVFNATFWKDNIPEYFARDTQAYFTLLGDKREVSPLRAENQLRGDFDITGNGHKLTVHLTLTPERAARIQEVSYSFS